MKPIYKILLIIGILILLGFLIYFVWNLLVGGPESEPNLENPPGMLPTLPSDQDGNNIPSLEDGVSQDDRNRTQGDTEGEALQKISDTQVFDYWIASNGEVYYLTQEGRVMNAKQGQDIEISGQSIEALNTMETSPQSDKVLVSFGDPQKPQWGIFDAIDKMWRPLPKDILRATWDMKENSLITIQEKLDDWNLVRLDLTKTPPASKLITKDFRFLDVRFTTVSPDEMFITEAPSAQYSSRVWKLNLKTLTLNTVLAPQQGQYAIWSHDRVVAFHFKNPNRFQILSGKTLELLTPIPSSLITLPEKCTSLSGHGTAQIFCFVPKNTDFLEPRAQYPDDYLQYKKYTEDDLYSINAESGDFSTLPLQTSLVFDGVHPRTHRENLLYFINRYDKHLYKLELR